MDNAVLTLAMDLIARPSVTPEDAGCQELILQRLEPLGFTVERLNYGSVTNFWARRGSGRPLLVFAGHTDVVPPGPLERWSSAPFVPTVRDGFLLGRGAADMKGGLAAMVTAAESFIAEYPDHRGSIGFLVTSDEEGIAIDGTARVIEHLQQRDGTLRVMGHLQQQGEIIDACVLGEPTSEKRVGDCVKNGRRGSLNGSVTVRGIQGHIAYPHLSDNPIHRFIPAMVELLAIEWDRGNEHFPPTGFQFSNVQAGTGTANVTPGECNALFNFRFSTAVTQEELQSRVVAVLERHGLDYQLEWSLSGAPFLTPRGILLETVGAAVLEVTGYPTRFSTAGGTSDGRFIAPTGAQVVELGPLNATIHQVNECVAVEDLTTLHHIYRGILKRMVL